jgi:hypothetical protein
MDLPPPHREVGKTLIELLTPGDNTQKNSHRIRHWWPIHPQRQHSPHDGKILQAIPNNGYAWHLGIGNQPMHRESIGIELCSFGYVTKGYFEKRENGKLQSIERKKDSLLHLRRPRSRTANRSQPSTNHSEATITGTNTAPSKSKHFKLLLEFLGAQHDIDIRKGLQELIKKYGSKAFDKLDIGMCRDNPGFGRIRMCRIQNRCFSAGGVG